MAQERRSVRPKDSTTFALPPWRALEARTQSAASGDRDVAALALLFAQVNAGRFAEAREALERLRADADTPVRRAAVRARTAWLLLEWGDADRALREAVVDDALAGDDPFEHAVQSVVRFAVGLATGREVESPDGGLIALLAARPEGRELLLAVAIAAKPPERATLAVRIARHLGEDPSPTRTLLAALASLDESAYERASSLLERAVTEAESAGFPRVAGRALVALAQLTADRGDANTPGQLLARAHPFVARNGSPLELLELRRAYRAHGRRAIDRLIPTPLALGLDQLFESRRRIHDAITEIAEQPARDLPLGLFAARSRAAEEALAEAERALTDGLSKLLVERTRSADLAATLSQLVRIESADVFVQAAAQAVARLFGADRVVLARLVRGRPEARGRVGALGDDWMASCAPDAPAARAAREGPELRGPRMAVALEVSDATAGWLYADRLARQGNFTAGDAIDFGLFAEYVAVAMARADALMRVSTSAGRLAATVAALRDGVLALDDAGTILVVNQSARRLLALPPDVDVGTPIMAVPALAALEDRLRSAPLPDTETLRFANSDAIVSARPLPLTADHHGVVVTLVDAGRARALAGTSSSARFTFTDLIGQAPEFQKAIAVARAAAPLDTTLLIIGESGTGKELVAQAVHNAGPRASEPFVAINCAALPRELIESELFGHERGAFTGARAGGAPGKLDLAGDGTLLLDEIGEMPLDLQAKLLRVLQERRFVPVGGTRERILHARVIATTNRDLEIEVQRGTFRLDLYHRLRVLFIQLPPLRQRHGDIPVLVNHTLRLTASRYGKKVRELAPSVMNRFEQHPWPGNVRELVNVVEAEVALATNEATVLTRVPPHFAPQPSTSSADETGSLQAIPAAVRSLEDVEREAVIAAVTLCGGNVAAAARGLGISKVTLYAKLKQYGVDLGGVRPVSSRWSLSGSTPAGGVPAAPPLPPRRRSDE